MTSRSHDPQFQTKELYIFGGLGAAAFFLSFFRAAVTLNALVTSSKNLHHSMLKAVLRAPVLFFDTNPAGRILNRFSRDIGIVDELLPYAFLDALLNSLFFFRVACSSVCFESLGYNPSHYLRRGFSFHGALLPQVCTGSEANGSSKQESSIVSF